MGWFSRVLIEQVPAILRTTCVGSMNGTHSAVNDGQLLRLAS